MSFWFAAMLDIGKLRSINPSNIGGINAMRIFEPLPELIDQLDAGVGIVASRLGPQL